MASFGGVAREAVTFVLTGDASGLIKTFGDVEKAADKSLKKAEDTSAKIGATLTKVGAVSVGVGLGSALGLVSAIKQTEEFDRAVDKLTTTVKGMGSAINVDEIVRFGAELQQVTKFTDEQIISAARWGATYKLTTTQIETVIKAAADLSTQTGQSLDATTRMIAQAASGGSVKALEKALKFKLDPAALEGDAFVATIDAVMSQAGGAAKKGVDTVTFQLERVGKNWDTIRENLGRGAEKVFEPLAKGAGDLTQWISELNPALQQAAGGVSAFGSIGATVFGGLATAGGQLANIREGFQGIGGLADKFGLSLGSIATGGIVLGAGLAAGTIALEKYADTQAKVSANADEVISNFKETGDAVKTLTDQLNSSANESEGWWERTFGGGTDQPQIASLSKLGISVGQVTQAVGNSLGKWDKYNELVQNAFENGEKFPKGVPKQLEALVKPVFDAVKKGVPGAADLYTELTDAINESAASADLAGERVKLQAGAYEVSAKKAGELSAEQKKLIDTAKNDPSLDNRLAALNKLSALNPKVAESIGLIADADKEAKKTADDQAKSMQDQIKTFDDLVKSSESGAQQMRDFAQATNEAGGKGLATSLEQLDTDEVAVGFLNMGDAMKEMQKTSKDLPHDFDALTAATGGYSDGQEAAIKATIGFATSLKTQASQLLASGASTDFVKGFLERGRQQIIDAGGEKWLEQLGLTDQQIEIAIKLAGEEEARQKLLFLSTMINTEFPPDVVHEINLRASTGDFTGALAVANAEMVKLQLANKEINIDANADGVTDAVEFANYLLFTGLVPPPAVPLDANNDGVVDTVEATNFLLSQGIKPPAPVPLDVNPAPANTKVADTTGKLNAFGLLKPSAWLDANNTPANTKTADSTSKVNAFGTLKPSSVLNAIDNASSIIGRATSVAKGFEGTYTATVNIRTVGEQEARQNIQAIKDAANNPNRSAPAPAPGPPVATPLPVINNINNVTVYVPAGANGRDIERTMRRHEARNGTRVGGGSGSRRAARAGR